MFLVSYDERMNESAAWFFFSLHFLVLPVVFASRDYVAIWKGSKAGTLRLLGRHQNLFVKKCSTVYSVHSKIRNEF